MGGMGGARMGVVEGDGGGEGKRGGRAMPRGEEGTGGRGEGRVGERGWG